MKNKVFHKLDEIHDELQQLKGKLMSFKDLDTKYQDEVPIPIKEPEIPVLPHEEEVPPKVEEPSVK